MERKDSDDKSLNKPKKSSGGVKKPKEKLDKSIEEVAERLADAAKSSGASTSTPQASAAAAQASSAEGTDPAQLGRRKKSAADRKSGRMIPTGPRPAEYSEMYHSTLVDAAAAARRRIQVDTVWLDLPAKDSLPAMVGQYFDPITPSFFLASGFLRATLMLNYDHLKSFEIRYMRNNKPRVAFIGGYCGHFVCTEDYHLLCRSCDYVATRLLCYKPGDCRYCKDMSKAERERRRDRNNRAPRALQLSTFGGRYEARHHLHRLYYLEGMLWCLAQCYEHAKNIRALRRLRMNIKQLHQWMSPHHRRPPSRIPGDVDEGEKPHNPIEGLTRAQLKDRAEMAGPEVWFDAEEMLATLELLATKLERGDTPDARRVQVPVQVGIAELPMALYIKDDELRRKHQDLYTARCNGYNAFRHEGKLRVFGVKMKPLSREEQSRLKLDRFGGQLKPRARKRGPDAKQKEASLRLDAKKIKREPVETGLDSTRPVCIEDSPDVSDADLSQDEQGSLMGILTLSDSESDSSVEMQEEDLSVEIDDEEADPDFETASVASGGSAKKRRRPEEETEEGVDTIADRVKMQRRVCASTAAKDSSAAAAIVAGPSAVVSIKRLGGFSEAETKRAVVKGYLTGARASVDEAAGEPEDPEPTTNELLGDMSGEFDVDEEQAEADVTLTSDEQGTGLSTGAVSEIISSMTEPNSPERPEESTQEEGATPEESVIATDTSTAQAEAGGTTSSDTGASGTDAGISAATAEKTPLPVTRTKATIGVRKRMKPLTVETTSTASAEATGPSPRERGALSDSSGSAGEPSPGSLNQATPKLTRKELLARYVAMAKKYGVEAQTNDLGRAVFDLMTHLECVFSELTARNEVMTALALNEDAPAPATEAQLSGLMAKVQSFVERHPRFMMVDPNPFDQLICLREYYDRENEAVVSKAYEMLRKEYLDGWAAEAESQGNPPPQETVLEAVNRGAIGVCEMLHAIRHQIEVLKERGELECKQQEGFIASLRRANADYEKGFATQKEAVEAANAAVTELTKKVRDIQFMSHAKMTEMQTLHEAQLRDADTKARNMEAELERLRNEKEFMTGKLALLESEMAQKPPPITAVRQSRESARIIGVTYDKMRQELIDKAANLASAKAQLSDLGVTQPTVQQGGESFLGLLRSPTSAHPQVALRARQEMEQKYVSFDPLLPEDLKDITLTIFGQ